jgi:hypothetical protein
VVAGGAAALSAQKTGAYEIVLAGERRLRLPAGFDAGEVAVLLTLLGARGC